MTEDPDLLSKLLAAMGVALTALGTWAWNHTHKRIDTIASKTDEKADLEEVNRHRDHIAKLFESEQICCMLC